MDKFLELEKILHFHHTTSRQPLRVAVVRLRCFQNGTAVSSEDIETILAIWPQAYKMYKSRGNLVMEAPDLPHNAQVRRETFAKLWEAKENIPAVCRSAEKTEGTTSQVEKKEAVTKRQPLQRVTRPILMGRLKKEPAHSSLGLLDRIRAKETKLKQERTIPSLQRTQDTYLRSQVPKLKRVLDELVSSGQCSLEMERVMEILRTNLFKLGDDELFRALQLFMQIYPAFCSIITIGSAKHLKLQKSPSVIC